MAYNPGQNNFAGLDDSDPSRAVQDPLSRLTVEDTAMETDPSTGPPSSGKVSQQINKAREMNYPFLEIVEQPKQRGFRFRYPCEGPSHGGLPGESSEKQRKTYPTVKLCNYNGASARVVVSLICCDDPLRPHAHSLVGKNVISGQCTVEVNAETKWMATFPNLGILHVTKKNVARVLLERYALALAGPEPPGPLDSPEPSPGEELAGGAAALSSLPREDITKLRQLADEQGRTMNLSAVRLCFQAFLIDENGRFTKALPPCISQTVYDSKAPSASTLKICRMDRHSGSVLGGDEVYLLCDRVQKDDIQVKFFEDGQNSDWEADAVFSPSDVHRQFAIVFKTPPYWNTRIDRPVNVWVALKRRSDGEVSEAKPFTYQPPSIDHEQIGRKRKKGIPHFTDHFGGPFGGPPGGQGGGGAAGGGMGGGGAAGGGPGGLGWGFGGGGGAGVGGNMTFGPSFGYHGGSNMMSQQQLGTGRSAGSVQLPPQAAAQQMTNTEQAGNSSKAEETTMDTDTGDTTQASASQGASNAMSLEQQGAQLAAAFRDYAATGDTRYLLAPQRSFTTDTNESGDTALHLAIIRQQPTVLGSMLDVLAGLPQNVLNTGNHLQQTPLHLAVITRQRDLIACLLQRGANALFQDRNGNTAAHLACRQGDATSLQALLTHAGGGRWLDALNYDGLSALHLAVKARSIDCLRLLVSKSADVNIHDGKSGRTPLHEAVEMKSIIIAGYLLTNGDADPNVKAYNGTTPLHTAAGFGHISMVKILLAANANPLEANEDGETPQHVASSDEVRQVLAEASISNSPAGTAVKPPGDLHRLDYFCRLRLSMLLEAGDRWRQLASLLSLDNLSPAFAVMMNPAKELLAHFEAADGTMEQLRSALQSMQCSDAVTLVENAMESTKDLRMMDVTQLPVVGDTSERVDSGVASLHMPTSRTQLPLMSVPVTAAMAH